MPIIETRDYSGYSEASLDDAIADALQQAEEHRYYKIIETRSSRFPDNKGHYHVILTTFCD